MIGWAPPAWTRPTPENGRADMAQIVEPPSIIRPMPETPANDVGSAEVEAARLHLEVRAAATRNGIVARRTQQQVAEVRSFEHRARDTLRDLVKRMGETNGTRD